MNFILNPLDEAKDCCPAFCVKPLSHVLDLPYWTYANLTNFIELQTIFMSQTEYPDELSFPKKT